VTGEVETGPSPSIPEAQTAQPETNMESTVSMIGWD